MRRLWPLALLLSACAGVSGISSSTTLPGDEATALRKKADEALAKKTYADAWNLEAEAGADQARLERIALASTEADDGPYEKMLGQLHTRFGRLSPEARARVTAVREKVEGERRWKDAAALEIAAADDPPTFSGALAVYDRTPPSEALAVLRLVQRARAEDAAARSKPPSPSAPTSVTPTAPATK